MSSRRLRAFKRWMISQGIECSDGLELRDEDEGISVRSICDLREGDLVATIPKSSCLTVKTSAAKEMIEEAGLGGSLGLAVAVMYERSLGESSIWDGYLRVLPEKECVPLVWDLNEVDELLAGTELHKIVKEDRALIYEDWKECILPLLASGPIRLEPKSFGHDQYLSAKSLVASRSFEIDDYHGFGMVPLADLFNHKTAAENVHFTSVSSDSSSQNDEIVEENQNKQDYDYSDKLSPEDLSPGMNGSRTSFTGNDNFNGSKMDFTSSSNDDDPSILEMIIVKDVKAGDEVFNTYGTMGNAALLHRYGFTEPDNPFDIVNIDLKLVIDWSSSLFSSRSTRARLSLWRKLDCSGCISQNSEYFEISSDGEPQLELLILLYIIFLPEKVYEKLNQTVLSFGNLDKSISSILLVGKNKSNNISLEQHPDIVKEYLRTKKVSKALVSLAGIRETFYGTNSLEDDMNELAGCCKSNRKLYHSLVLRVNERRILKKLRIYASSRPSKSKKKRSMKRGEMSRVQRDAKDAVAKVP